MHDSGDEAHKLAVVIEGGGSEEGSRGSKSKEQKLGLGKTLVNKSLVETNGPALKKINFDMLLREQTAKVINKQMEIGAAGSGSGNGKTKKTQKNRNKKSRGELEFGSGSCVGWRKNAGGALRRGDGYCD